jgi:hypothetical protein
MDSFHTSCGSWAWEKNTRVRPSQNWAQKTPKFKAKGQKRATQKTKKGAKKKEKKEKKVYIQRHICSLEKLC